MIHLPARALRVLTGAALFTLSAPLFAQGTNPTPVIIDFDHDASGKLITAPALFNSVSSPSLSTLYSSLGVTFSGPAGMGANSGGVILDKVKGYFTVPTRSGANFLAFQIGTYASGPETLTFSKPVTSVTINAISPGSCRFTMTAYNSANVQVDTYSVYAAEYDENNFDFSYYPLTVRAGLAGNISRVTLTQQSINPVDNTIYEYDDLTFVPAPQTNFSGQIALEGIKDLSRTAFTPEALTFAFRLPGTTTALYTVPVTLKPVGSGSPFGTFQLSVIPGIYDVAIKGPKSLRVVYPAVTIGTATVLPDTTLPGGDANNDNFADLGDFAVLVDAYENVASDPNGYYDVRADFNDDGRIDISDFGILANEFSLSGAP